MTPGRWLAAFGAAVAITHHLGALPGGLGRAGGSTRWVDWLDLLTPYLVVGTALAFLVAAGAARSAWPLAAAAAVAYVQGHGVHLAANSVGNARGDGAPVHLWDEVVGHCIWYAGLGLLLVAVALTSLRAGTTTGGAGLLLAGAVGLTWATNALEGGTVAGSLPAALALSAWGWRRRGTGTGRLLLAAFPLSAVVLLGWGAVHAGWPQPSDVGLL